ncbi:MAG: hypothetical protein U0893_07435 [Chloroflexota bacterium]
MFGAAGARAPALILMIAALLLTACGIVSPAAPTPTPAPAAAAGGRGFGGGGGGGGGGAGGPGGGFRGGAGGGGQGQGQGRGQGQGQAGGNTAAQGQDQGQGQGQARGQGQGQGGPGGGFRGPQAAGTPNPNSPFVNGEVDIIDGRVVTVATNTGWRKVQIPDDATITTEGKGTPTDLVASVLVGVTSKPDGTAAMIRIFPAGVTPRTGQFPMNGTNQGNTMTNAKIETFDGKLLSLDYDGNKASITVLPETDIVKPVQAAFGDIAVGARVQAAGTVSGDTLTARTVTLFTGQAAQPGGQRGQRG